MNAKENKDTTVKGVKIDDNSSRVSEPVADGALDCQAGDNDDESDNDPSSEAGAPLSKRALKRLKKKEIWMATKGQRRAAEKERRKKRAAEDRQKRMEDPESANIQTFHQFRKKLKKNRMSTSSCRVSVVVDCDWEHLMEMKDIQKLAKQIQYAYTTNRRLDDPVQFFVTGLKPGSMLKGKLDNDYSGYLNWDVNFKPESYDECFNKEKIVYLTSESEHVLEKMEDDKVYIIGGLVDHNQHKGVCHSTAMKRGISHARLPIDEFLEMKTRKVLTVNHVFDILASASSGKSWEDAFITAIPSRKGAVAKEDDGTEKTPKEENLEKDDKERSEDGLEPEDNIAGVDKPSDSTEEVMGICNGHSQEDH